MNKWCVDDIVVEATQNIFGYAVTRRVFNVVRSLHFTLVVFVKNIRVENDNGEGDEVSLVYFLLAGDGPCSKGVHTWINVYARITFVISVRKTLKNTVNLLRLLWQFHLHK